MSRKLVQDIYLIIIGGKLMNEAISSGICELTYSEKRVVENVLAKYDFKVLNIYRVRSVYKIETSSGNVCLKRMKHGRKKVENGANLVEGLLKNNFTNIAKYYKTKEDKLLVERKKYIFYATEWINGEECHMSDLNEAYECVKLLADFHSAVRNIDRHSLRIKSNLKNWPEIFSKSLFDFERYKRIIENKKIKNQFDIEYLNYIDDFYARGMLSIQLLNKSQYYNLSRQAAKERTLCHDSYYYQNIIKKEGTYYLIDLDSIIFDLQINDLGKLIRRLMFKKEYGWDFEKAKLLINAYNSVLRLSGNELEVMLALIIFPHKFWKLGNKRYTKHKNWSEEKYLHKLNKLVRYDEMEEAFLQNYLRFLDSYSD